MNIELKGVGRRDKNYREIMGTKFNNAKSILTKGAFGEYGGYITSMRVPDGIISIEADAFSSCEKLTSISIPNSVTSISRSAFDGCSRLTNVTIPQRFDTGLFHSNLKSIFKNCYKNITFTFT